MPNSPFENISSFNNGPNGAYVNTMLIKPVYPIKLTENWNRNALLLRP